MFRELLDLDNATDKYEWIIDYGERGISLDQGHCVDANLVRGCQSPLWLARYENTFVCHADSMIVNGIAKMIVDYYNQADEGDRQYFDLATLTAIGLAPLLSMGRQNGVANLIRRLKELT
jgi:cysteine desulfuration protein SufE